MFTPDVSITCGTRRRLLIVPSALTSELIQTVDRRRSNLIFKREDNDQLSVFFHRQDESAEDTPATKAKRGKKSKSVIDFNDFETLELHDLVGKSNNLKEGAQKSLKFLTRRFTQLETNLSQLSSPIEILSTQGEVIGTKYDFR